MEVNRNLKFVCLLTSFLTLGTAQATPSYITFSNSTSLSLNTFIAGLPGYGIEPNVTSPVSYNIVSAGCTYNGVATNCPIEFYNRHNGEKVATVFINANTATLTGQPVFHGMYGEEYEVRGWEQSPLNRITIIRRENRDQA